MDIPAEYIPSYTPPGSSKMDPFYWETNDNPTQSDSSFGKTEWVICFSGGLLAIKVVKRKKIEYSEKSFEYFLWEN